MSCRHTAWVIPADRVMTARPAGAHACRPVFPLKDNIPTDRFPIVTLALIVTNAMVYFLLQDGGWELTSSATGDWPVRDYALVPCDISGACEARASHVGGVASFFRLRDDISRSRLAGSRP